MPLDINLFSFFSLIYSQYESRFVLITNLRTLVVSQIPFISAYKVSSLYHCEVMAVVPVIQTQNLRTPWARLKDWCLYGIFYSATKPNYLDLGIEELYGHRIVEVRVYQQCTPDSNPIPNQS